LRRYETTIDVGRQTDCRVSGLDPAADYYFVVKAYNVFQQESPPSNEVSSEGKKDRTPPVISGVHIVGITSSSAIVTWVTDEPTQGWLNYGKEATALDHVVYSPTKTTQHQAILNELAASTTYFYRITAIDAAGNKATWSEDFTTALAQIPLVIFSLKMEAIKQSKTDAYIKIGWKTNRPATSRVEYGPTTAYGKVSERKSRHVAHSRVMRRLRFGQTFYFRVTSVGSEEKVATSTGKFKVVLNKGKPVIHRYP